MLPRKPYRRGALIFHDDRALQTQLAARLTGAGIATSMSEGIGDFLALAFKLQPAFVITEMRLIDRDDIPGPRAIQAIRQSVPGSCIVVVTRYGSVAGHKAAMAPKGLAQRVCREATLPLQTVILQRSLAPLSDDARGMGIVQA